MSNFNDKDLEFDALMKRMASDHQVDLPSAQAIWWRARIQKKLENEARVERPLMMVRVAVTVLGFIGALALAMRFHLLAEVPAKSGHVFTFLIMAAVFVLLGLAVSMPERLRGN